LSLPQHVGHQEQALAACAGAAADRRGSLDGFAFLQQRGPVAAHSFAEARDAVGFAGAEILSALDGLSKLQPDYTQRPPSPLLRIIPSRRFALDDLRSHHEIGEQIRL
jgi:hypothetical protein